MANIKERRRCQKCGTVYVLKQGYEDLQDCCPNCGIGLEHGLVLANEEPLPDHILTAKKVFFVMETQTNEAGEYRALIAVEGEQGFFLTDWFWGDNFETAKQIASERNAVMGYSPKEAMLIQLRTMRF